MTHPPEQRRRRHPRRRRAGPFGIALFAVVALLGTLLGCSSAEPGDPKPRATVPEPTPTDPTTTTTTLEDVEDAVSGIVLEASASFYDVLLVPDPADDRLELHRTGPSLESVRTVVDEFVREGLRADYPNGPPETSVEQAEVSGDRATVTTCVVDRAHTVRVDDGSIVNSVISSTRQRYYLEFHSSWLVNDVELIEKWEGTEGCG